MQCASVQRIRVSREAFELLVAPLCQMRQRVLKRLANRVYSFSTTNEAKQIATLNRAPAVESADSKSDYYENAPRPYRYPSPQRHVLVCLSTESVSNAETQALSRVSSTRLLFPALRSSEPASTRVIFARRPRTV